MGVTLHVTTILYFFFSTGRKERHQAVRSFGPRTHLCDIFFLSYVDIELMVLFDEIQVAYSFGEKFANGRLHSGYETSML